MPLSRGKLLGCWFQRIGLKNSGPKKHHWDRSSCLYNPFWLEHLPNGDYTGALRGGLIVSFWREQSKRGLSDKLQVTARSNWKKSAKQYWTRLRHLHRQFQKVQDCRARHPNDSGTLRCSNRIISDHLGCYYAYNKLAGGYISL